MNPPRRWGRIEGGGLRIDPPYRSWDRHFVHDAKDAGCGRVRVSSPRRWSRIEGGGLGTARPTDVGGLGRAGPTHLVMVYNFTRHGNDVVDGLRSRLPEGRPYKEGVSDWKTMVIASLGVLFIGIAKAGFGGGLGMLTTPLCVLAFGVGGKEPAFAVGTVLPLLCVGDVFSMYYYWGKWDRRNLKFLLPGVVAGVMVGVHLIDRFSAGQLNVAIGVIAVLFVLFQLVKERVFRAEGAFAPNHLVGVPCGVGTGITSTFAHGAGPVVSMFLIPQQMPKEVYMGTSILVFTWVNWIKLPFFVWNRIITPETLWTGLYYSPLVPVGVWIGVWMNRRCSEDRFLGVVYLTLFLAGLQLIFDFDLGRLLR